MTQYIIQFRLQNDKTEYIRETYDYDRHPMLTPVHNRVSSEYIFDSISDADKQIDAVINCVKNHLKLRNVNTVFQTWEKIQNRKSKKFMDKTRYSIVEYVPEFIYKKHRKSFKREWIDDISAQKFCNNCGAVMHAKKYYSIANVKICVFCLKQLGIIAEDIINKEKLNNSNIEDDHNNQLFVEHM